MKKLVTLFIYIGLIFTVNKAKSQASWNQIATLPDGASIVDLAVDNNDVVYALTYFTSDIYYTLDNGLAWTRMPGTNVFSNANDIEIDKSTNTLYVGTLSGGLHWTSNKGLSWQNQPFYTIPVSGSQAYINRTIRKPGTGIIICNEPGMFTNSVIYRSANAGSTWNSYSVGFGGVYDFKYLANGHLLAGTENGVFRSIDDGLTWTTSNTGIANLKVSSILQKTSSSLIFAATEFNYGSNDTSGCGVFISNNGGNTWINSSSGMTDKRITCLSRDSTSGVIYASYYGGVYRSTNDGQSWTTVNTSLGNNDYTSIVANSSGLFLGSRKAGIDFSSVPVSAWNQRNSGIKISTISHMVMSPNSNINILDESNTGVFSLNQTTWTRLNNGLPSTGGQKIAKDNAGNMYVSYKGDSIVLFKSNNQGLSWTPISTLPLANNIYWAGCSALKVDKYNNVYVVLEFSSQMAFQPPQLYRSTDYGSSWTLLHTMDDSTYISLNDVDLLTDSTIYLTLTDFSSETKLLYSNDWGTSFSVAAININPVSINADLVVAPNDSLYLVHDNKVYKRSGIGAWNQIPTNPWPYDPNPITKLYIDNQNRLYVTSLNYAVYFSTDDGASWANISTGLPVFTGPLSPPLLIQLYDLQFNSANEPYAIATDDYSGSAPGIYKYSVPTTTTAVYYRELESEGVEISIYPNPVTDLCKISYRGIQNGKAEILVYNISGQVVKACAENEIRGNSEITLDMTGFSRGLYLIKAIANNKIYAVKFIKQ